MTKRELYIGTITGVAGNFVYALIEALGEKWDGLWVFLKNVITAQIPLWYFLVVVAAACLIVFLMLRGKKKQPAFLMHTEEEYMGYKFQWVWKLNEETGHYEMNDFWPICPQCGLQLRVDQYDPIDAYHCTNGHYVELDRMLSLKRDLLHKLQRDNKEYASIIDYPDL